MERKEFQRAGYSLMIGSFLMIITMVLHPVGGDFNHLVRIISMGRITHGIAIISLPFVAYGFWGLTEKLGGNFVSRISFLFMLFGLIAVMLAAAVNGLILMDFVSRYKSASQEVIDSLKPFFRLLSGFNHAFDFIFIGAVCISTCLWSMLMLKMKSTIKYLGWLGIGITLVALISLILGVVFVDLHGFRIFIFGWVVWLIGIGIFLTRK